MTSQRDRWKGRPRTIAELADVANSGLQWSPRYPLKTWLKGTLSLVRTADDHEKRGDSEQAFILLARAATVILERLPTHPDFAKSLSSTEKANLRHNGETYLRNLQRLKITLLNRFDKWHLQNPDWSIEAEHAATSAQSSNHPEAEPAAQENRTSLGDRARPESSAKKNTVHWEKDEPKWNKEQERSDLERDFGKMRLSPRPQQQQQQQQQQHSRQPPSHLFPQSDHRPSGYGTPPPFDQYTSAWQPFPMPQAYPKQSYVPISYPSVPPIHRHAEPYVPQYPTSSGNLYDGSSTNIVAPPAPPPPSRPRPHAPSFPPLPDGVKDYYGSRSSTPGGSQPSTQPPTQAATPVAKASGDRVGEGAMLLGGLRRLSIPSSVLSTFLELARPQTNRKIETCALLLGTQRERFGSSAVQELVVEVLLVPKQKGTSDTCQMEQEEMVVEVQLERGLIALGWIHTHPTQSCFMSSMDLHTHAAYQQTLPEAVAIVCAPKSDPSYGIFRLTEPGGLTTIINCRHSALFHEHPDIKGGIYTDADHGHVRLTSSLPPLEVIDLRRK